MRQVRRHDHSPRVEMMPLIDVVFLLLTFFIYAMVVMVELKSSGVALVSVEGASDAVDESIVLLEVDGNGGVLLDGAVVPDDELDGRLRELAGLAAAPPLVVTLQAVDSPIDRGPGLMRLLDRIQRAGVVDIRLPKLEGGSGVSP
ncbi:MAG: biopolymer transporter ExbD [Planctomycetota bacterium]